MRLTDSVNAGRDGDDGAVVVVVAEDVENGGPLSLPT